MRIYSVTRTAASVTGSTGIAVRGYSSVEPASAEQVHTFFLPGDPPNVTGFADAPGQWFIVPAPAMGAGLPALLAFASFGWWRRRTGILSARLS